MALDFSKYTPKRPSSCESCEFYVYDEYTEEYSCSLSLDEDEMGDFLGGNNHIALIFTIFIVGDDDHFALPDIFNDLFRSIEYEILHKKTPVLFYFFCKYCYVG